MGRDRRSFKLHVSNDLMILIFKVNVRSTKLNIFRVKSNNKFQYFLQCYLR